MSVTAAGGFRAAGVAAGLKTTGLPDVALVVNDGPSYAAAAVFTGNRVQAAPVVWSRQVVTDGRVDAVVLNSGGANACTGAAGFQDTHRSAEEVAGLVGCSAADVAVASTGLIGLRLPMDRLLGGVRQASGLLSADGGGDAALAIMTTDSVPKKSVVHADGYTIGGMAKGAGMLAPALATMLVVITTDADLGPAELDKALRSSTGSSFDRIDSDGCMSTNDMVLLMASGASGVRPGLDTFTEALRAVCADLARQLIADAEGASKEIAITVQGAVSEAEAVDVARTVSRSNLLKCALHGEDANWGRVLSAVGTTSAVFEPDQLDVAINGVWVCRGGAVGEDRSLVDMTGREIAIVVDLHAGPAQATVWTNDLTAEYVHENSAYSS
ncbi:MAG: glutamate N-acetyltransferase / amino-acid N-acetyltransferase [Frankiales bacterium]|nr:glutamate N-acetyltransferase / amino-acid N-acetyltransferase [Frankiales bacterium]